MKLVEILPYLEKGEKIRKTYWENGRYIKRSLVNGIIFNEKGIVAHTEIDIRDVWELYEAKHEEKTSVSEAELFVKRLLENDKKLNRDIK